MPYKHRIQPITEVTIEDNPDNQGYNDIVYIVKTYTHTVNGIVEGYKAFTILDNAKEFAIEDSKV